MHKRTKLLAGLFLSAAMCFAVGAGISVTASAEESFGTSWTAAGSGATVTNVSEGGVGTFTYYAAESSIKIPVSGHEAANGFLSIKYSADFDVDASAVALRAYWDNDAANQDVCVNIISAWNATVSDTEDGYKCTTINVGNYTAENIISSIRLKFYATDDATVAKNFAFMGLDFHAKDEAPKFVTDSTDVAVKGYAVSNEEYFTSFERIQEDNYQVHMVRNTEVGYPTVKASIANWTSEYDTLTIDVKCVGVSLLGIRITPVGGSEITLIDHWNPKNFLQTGEYQFTYSNFGEGVDMNGATVTIYPNPASITTDGYTGASEIKLGMKLSKSTVAEEPAWKTAFDAVAENMYMTAGASIRLVEGSNGIRFETNVSVATADALAALVGNGITAVNYGTLVIPVDYFVDGATPASLHKAGKVLDIASTGFYAKASTTETYKFWGSIVNLNDYNYTREFIGIGYVQVTAADGETYFAYASYDLENARSMYEVAKAAYAVKDQFSEEQVKVLTAYLDSVVVIDAEGNYVGGVDGYTPAYQATVADGVCTVVSTAEIKTVVYNGETVKSTNLTFGKNKQSVSFTIA